MGGYIRVYPCAGAGVCAAACLCPCTRIYADAVCPSVYADGHADAVYAVGEHERRGVWYGHGHEHGNDYQRRMGTGLGF